jgi:hypothetical protein
MFGDAAIVYDEGGSDTPVFAVLFVVVDLDDSDAAPVRKRDRVTVADRAACVSDDRYFATGQVDEAETCHSGRIIAQCEPFHVVVNTKELNVASDPGDRTQSWASAPE